MGNIRTDENIITSRSKFTGRKVIFSDAAEINAENVIEELKKAMDVHSVNSAQIDYLYRYYKGDQPVLNREKTVREEICNDVVENRANEIVSFKVGYLMGEPVQYVSNGEDQSSLENLKKLNRFMKAAKKKMSDRQLAEWFYICGTAYRLALPTSDPKKPISITTLDPRYAFVVYRNNVEKTPLMGVTYVVKEGNKKEYGVYTKDHFYSIVDEKVVSEYGIITGGIPIIEYPANNARLGSFEIVLSLLDAIDTVESNRVDGIEQFVQAIMVFKGVDVDSDQWNQIKEEGAVLLPAGADAKYLCQELNQTQTQTLIDHMYQAVLTICGMPSQGNGQTSDSSNNGAVILRNGWQSAEARAKDTEIMFESSETDFLELVLNYTGILSSLEIDVADIEIRFTRRNYENITEKTNVLKTMLSTDKIHPKLAFTHCGLFSDPDLAFNESQKYYLDTLNQEEGDLDGKPTGQFVKSYFRTDPEQI